MFFDKVAIIGVGLIGASFGLALREKGLCRTIHGFSRNTENVARGCQKGIIDHYSDDLTRVCEGADLVLLATPVGAFTEIVSLIRQSLKRGALVTDVGSVKGTLIYDIESLLPEGVTYVSSHPIAGSEKSGIDNADAALFLNTRCIITPTDKTDRDAFEKIQKLWESFGAEVITMSPEEHDRVFGAVSHLPHIIAYELITTADAIGESYLNYSGRGFRDITRIASSSPELWRDICIYNRENLVHFIDLFMGRLERVKGYLVSSDALLIEEEFKKAKSLKDNIGQS